MFVASFSGAAARENNGILAGDPFDQVNRGVWA
jgi:hypothetical protein